VKATEIKRLDSQLTDFLDSLTEGAGRPERRRAMRDYVTGLLLDGERKSTAPMAARLASSEAEAAALRERLQQCVADSPWSDALLYQRLAAKLVKGLPKIQAFVFDDTGFPKKGTHSVGVARQYSGTLGRVELCQTALSLHVAGESTSGCIGMRLYLPSEWTDDRERCRQAGVPDEVVATSKWRIALQMLERTNEWGLPRFPVLADSAFGDCADFREQLDEWGYAYVVQISGTAVFWQPGDGPLPPPKPTSKRGGRPPSRWRDGGEKPASAKQIAAALAPADFRRVTWREGSRGKQQSRFAAVRVRSARRHAAGHAPGKEEWLVCEWPSEEKGPSRFWLSTLPSSTSLKRLVLLGKMRWRIERDYQEMKQEVGLDHFEGRGWRGFHHHATLCALAHGFLALHRALSPPKPA
jgi:SRSO17 transposase